MKLAKLEEIKSTIRFSAKLSRPKATEKTGLLAILALPKNASENLPAQGMTMVEGTINGFPFRASLEPSDEGRYWLWVSEALQNAAGAEVEETVIVEITRVGEEPEIRVPLDLRQALADAPAALAAWEDITPMARRDWILWVSSAKQLETRMRRIENACDMLASGKRRPCCFPNINWRTKDHVKSDETWLPLASSKKLSSTRSKK